MSCKPDALYSATGLASQTNNLLLIFRKHDAFHKTTGFRQL